MIKRDANRIIGWLLVLGLLCSAVSVSGIDVQANVDAAVTAETQVEGLDGTLPFMRDYLIDMPKTAGQSKIVLTCADALNAAGNVPIPASDAEYTEGDVLALDETSGTVTFRFSVATAGLYYVSTTYRVLGTGSNGVRSLLLDGQTLYSEMENVSFYRQWQDSGKPMVNSLGDQVLPGIEEVPCYTTAALRDSSGYNTTPLLFYLESGEHTLSFVYVSRDILIRTVTVQGYTPLPSYKQVAAGYTDVPEGQGQVTFQAEDAMTGRNSASIRLDSHSDPSTEPHKYGYKVYNAVGGSAWRSGNQEIEFTFSAEKTGLYRLVLRAGQLWKEGMPSYRMIAIDGQVPFAELEAYRFDYDDRWQTVTLGGDEPYLFLLEAGTHTMTLTVTLGEMTPVIQTLYRNMSDLSEIVLDISRITGNSPDPNYDYKFFRNIPTLENRMRRVVEDLQLQYDRILSVCGGSTGMTSNLVSVARQIESMLEDPFSIASRYSQLTSAQSSLGAWYMELQHQPLGIDEFTVAGAQETVPHRRSNFFQRMKGTIINIILSFTKDYNIVSSLLSEDVQITDTIDVWIARGIEWAEMVKELAHSSFTPESGIAVRMKVVPASQLNTGSANMMLLSIIAGNEPDVAMGVTSNSPVEFAIRDSVVDLSEMRDFESVQKRFLPNIFTPFMYQNGIYALPETMNFTVLYYRKDILKKYQIAVPDTREQLYHEILPALFKNGKSYYQPADYATFLYQHGGSYYTEDGMRSALDTADAYDAFVEYTQMYTQYGVPVSANFFNRFRTGEMPMGVGNYTLYLQLLTSAPELVGKWDIAPVPGIKQADGSINRSVGGIAGECDILLKKEDGHDYSSAWKFLQWWSSESVQRSYATQIESLIGVESRWNTANLDVFLSLDWTPSHVRVLKEMWNWAQETPVVLGGYYTSRHLTNAYTNVVVSGSTSARDALETAVKAINRELRVKQEEYGVYADN